MTATAEHSDGPSNLKLNLEFVLPKDAGACDACVARILDLLRGRAGVVEVHVDARQEGGPRLCLHFDPAVLSLDRVRALVEQAGARLGTQFKHLSMPVRGLRHERHAKVVEGLLAKQPGVLYAAIAFGTRRVLIEFDPAKTSRETLAKAVESAGLLVPEEPKAAVVPPKEHEEGEHSGPFGERTELIFSLASGAFTGAGWLLAKAGGASAISIGLFIAAYVLASWFTVKEVVVAFRARKLEIDFLMLVAALGAAILGVWFEGALLLFLFTLGHALEGFAMGRARRAIEALSKLVPETALRLDPSGSESEVGVTDLQLGDRVLVKPNTRIPVDGFILSGEGSVNQAPITGESMPVDKRPVLDAGAAAASPGALPAENRVFAGTVNGPSVLTVSVTKVAADSTLARVVKMVSEAETQKSPTQQFTDRFERVFVPVVMGLVALLMFAWVVVDEPFAKSFYRAMAVLVAASPCALAIATPSAVLAGVARAARGGVLVKGGAHLESLGRIKAMAFDKTGTLTEGKPKLTDVAATRGSEESELLRVALAVEKQSDHPLASAVVVAASARLPLAAQASKASEVRAITGFGIQASVDGKKTLIGKPGLFTRDGALPEEVAALAAKLQADGRSVMVVKWGDVFLGVLGMMDTPRQNAREVVAELQGLGVRRTILLTGDNQQTADAVARLVGIGLAQGDLLPEQKVAAVAEMARVGPVAMVGDGVNDAPAMANATVGITMGAGGSDVALETADVALMADDLGAIPFAVGLSRKARGIILQNLWASLGVVAFLIPATILGFAGIGIAVALHEGSTLLVVANALRLLAYRRPPGDAAARRVARAAA